MNVNHPNLGKKLRVEIIYNMFKSYSVESGIFIWNGTRYYFRKGELMRFMGAE